MKSIAQQLVEKGMKEGIELGKLEGRLEGRQEGQIKFATNLILSTEFDDEKIASLTELVIEQVSALRTKLQGK